MRKPILVAGAIMLVFGLVVFVICVVQVTQASADFVNCMNGNPINYPYGSVPSACTTAMSAMILYGSLEWIGILVGIVGFVLVLLGLLLQPPQPLFAPSGYYPPPPAVPPPGPQAPPPPF